MSNELQFATNYLATEVWTPINGFEHLYEVSSFGRVRSIKGNTKLKASPDNSCGYPHVALYKNGKRHNKYVHRLVAEAFIPNPNGLSQVNHKDEDKHNNHVCNLEWCSPQYNSSYGTRGERVKASHDKRKKPFLCEENMKVYFNQTDCAKELGLWQPNIGKVLNGCLKKTGGYHFTYVGGINYE